ncbi:MAG: hypothetical protein ACE5EM_04475 [Sphingomonadales bacterium]
MVVGKFRGLMLAGLVALAVAGGGSAAPASAQDTPAYLYRVTTLRAAPGKLTELIDFVKARVVKGSYGARGQQPPMVMRHSQGDQWDLLLLQPVGNYAAHFANPSARRRINPIDKDIDRLTVFREDLLAFGPPTDEVHKAFDANAFFHVEMFAAQPGKYAELYRQRQTENQYLEATGRKANMIWSGDLGSDFDLFTIGFYPSIVEFAKPSTASDEERDQAAKDAGYESSGAISTYLRELIVSHHDTLATKVKIGK